MKKQYKVELSQEERNQLTRLTTQGAEKVRKVKRAKILLQADEGKKDQEIAERVEVSVGTVERIRKRYVQEGLEGAVNEKPRSGRPIGIDAQTRAKVTALACTKAPEGRSKWTLRLLADKVVELEYIDSISYQSVRNILKKNELKPHLKSQWCIGQLTPLFLWLMERILWLYALPYDPKRPLWCFDERPCQLLGDTLVPIPMKPGKKWRYDHHYERKGVCNILIAFQPHTGQRVVQVRPQRRAKEYAEFMVELKTVHNPEADTLQIVQDNLNTHSPSSFYTILPPAQALAMANSFEMNYTPKNASWLNMVEIELSVIARQCLNRRLDSMPLLEQEVQTLVQQRNEAAATVNWQFTPELARDKFKRFYPKLDHISG